MDVRWLGFGPKKEVLLWQQTPTKLGGVGAGEGQRLQEASEVPASTASAQCRGEAPKDEGCCRESGRLPRFTSNPGRRETRGDGAFKGGWGTWGSLV